MNKTTIPCPICGTEGEVYTFCKQCHWFLVEDLTGTLLAPLPQADLERVNAALAAYRAGWQNNTRDPSAELLREELRQTRALVSQLSQQLAEVVAASVQSQDSAVVKFAPVLEPLYAAPDPQPVSADPKDFQIKGNHLTRYRGSQAVVQVPPGIKAIQREAFILTMSLEQVILPDSVTDIGPLAFAYCENLREINFPSSLQTIGKSAFLDCGKLKEVTIPQFATVADSAFAGCPDLKINRV